MFVLINYISIRLFVAGIYIASVWNPKARQWVRGRKNILSRIQQSLKGNTRPVVWMHTASLGEFEQGRTLVENIRATYPGSLLVVTFFSPSGYEAVKSYKGVDHIFYLPVPTKKNARKFVNILNPELVLWIKYDYWFHFLNEVKKRGVPLLLISAIFNRNQTFFKWYGVLYKRMLHSFTWMFVQTVASKKRLGLIGFTNNVTVSGDTRFDRVIDIAENFEPLPDIEDFIGDSPVIVAGSTWPEDEEELSHYANTHRDIKFIIAPHEIDEEHIRSVRKLFHHSVRYSAFKSNRMKKPTANTLIIDNIGMLSRLYHYASIAYVGGGFGNDGVHNVLEAAVFGKPVIFGPVFNRFQEAIDLLEEGAALTVNNALGLEGTLNNLLADSEYYRECCEAARRYVYSNKGATQKIMEHIQENRLLISS